MAKTPSPTLQPSQFKPDIGCSFSAAERMRCLYGYEAEGGREEEGASGRVRGAAVEILLDGHGQFAIPRMCSQIFCGPNLIPAGTMTSMGHSMF